MHYVRFLKQPYVQRAGSGALECTKAIVSLTTDLGDTFFAQDVELRVLLKSSASHDATATTVLAAKNVLWKAGMRVLAVEVPLKSTNLGGISEMVMCIAKATKSDSLYEIRNGLISMQDVVAVCSAPMLLASGSQLRSQRVQRTLQLKNNAPLVVSEEVGDSIARHAWDGGLAFIAALDCMGHSLAPQLQHLQELVTSKKQQTLKIIELGTGCGIVSAALASIWPHCHILATDLPEAEETVASTFEANGIANTSSVRFQVLDWQEPLPRDIADSSYDVIVAVECIYNDDSIPALVRTMATLSKGTPNCLAILATKNRHPNEFVFFELMDKAGFVEKERSMVLAPYGFDDEDATEGEKIDVYTYIFKNETVK